MLHDVTATLHHHLPDVLHEMLGLSSDYSYGAKAGNDRNSVWFLSTAQKEGIDSGEG